MATIFLNLFLLFLVQASADPLIGVNYGRVGNNLPSHSKVVSLLKGMNVGMAKIFDADAQVLQAFANSGIKLAIMVTNEELEGVANAQATADKWVEEKVVPYYPATDINAIIVANELLSDYNKKSAWTQLAPAMKHIRTALLNRNLNQISVTTAIAADALSVSYPPSSGKFRDDIATSVMAPILQFLSESNSPYYANFYPYLSWVSNPKDISLEYALFGTSQALVQDSSYGYTNLLDASTDATYAAMEKLGYPNVGIVISETGWPTKGDSSETGANPQNAQLYNQRLVTKAAVSNSGSPRRRGVKIPVYIFALFNENQKSGPERERNWGLLYPDGSSVYSIDLTGGSTNLWCVANSNAGSSDLQGNLDWACANTDCSEIQRGGSCFDPDTVLAHASYAFNKYFQANKKNGGTCDFSGTAIAIFRDPSYNNCKYEASGLSSSSLIQDM